MSDQFSESSSTSWFSRLAESIKGVLVGLVLFVLAIPLLWWNEGRAVQTFKSLTEGAGAVVSVQADKVDAANEGKLVHMSGKATTTATVTDPLFGVSANALRLERKAEMYQWKESTKTEKKKKLGGGEETITTYTYSKEWDDSLIKSSEFKEPKGHTNPAAMPVSSEGWRASPVTLGAFTLNTSQVDEVGGEEKLAVNESMLKKSDAAEGAKEEAKPAEEAKPEEETKPAEPAPKSKKLSKKEKQKLGKKAMAKQEKQAKKGSKPAPSFATAAVNNPAPPSANTPPKVVDGGLYLGRSPQTPEVGDVRVSFTKVPPADISIIAQQVGQTFQPYKTEAGDALQLMQAGTQNAAAMFKTAQENNATLTWILRLVFFVMMAIGVYSIFKPLAVVADVVPFFGSMIAMGLGVVAIAIAAPVTLLTIAFAWIYYRPVMGVLLLLVSIGVFVGIKVLAGKRKVTEAVPA
jgi:hypothetical protein